MSDTDWIKAGADVVIYRTGRLNPASSAKLTTIKRVAKQSFTVEDEDARFRISDQQSKGYGGTWNGWTYVCIPYDSDKAKELLRERRRLHLEYKAREACETWHRDRTEENRLTAVEALTKLGEFGPRPTEET